MITTSKVVAGIGIGGALALIGTIAATTEPESLFQLHAAIVLGIGGGMLKIGWETVKNGRQTLTVLREVLRMQKEDRANNDRERDAAVGKVMTVVKNGNERLVAGHAKLMEGVQELLLDLEERRKGERRQGDRRGAG